MPLEKLTEDQLERRPSGRIHHPYLDFLKTLEPGQGGRTTTDDEGVTKQTIKNRLNRAAQAAGVEVEYLRTPPDEVVFRLTG